MDQQIISNTSNVLHSFECVFKKGEDGQWNSKDRALRKKLEKIQALCKEARIRRPIKFLAINSVIMEAYTLWWNGGSVRSFWRTNSLVKLSEEYEYITQHPDHPMDVLEQIKAFCTKRAKLAMSLIMTMVSVHKKKIFHNDISPSNILLHFPPDHVDRV
jgi:serine/threonine protein kinase